TFGIVRKNQGAKRVLIIVDPLEFLARRGIPEAENTALFSCRQGLAIGGKGEGSDPAFAVLDRMQFLASCDLPPAELLISHSRGQDRTIRGQRRRCISSAGRAIARNAPNFCSRFRVPD